LRQLQVSGFENCLLRLDAGFSEVQLDKARHLARFVLKPHLQLSDYDR
jgi:hypothetical protein